MITKSVSDNCKYITLCLLLLTTIRAGATNNDSTASDTSRQTKPTVSNLPPLVKSAVGDHSTGDNNDIRIVNIGKRQQHTPSERDTYDTDIYSPKSATFSKDGSLLYVNSLEGCKTAVYEIPSLRKKAVIEYDFPTGTDSIWAKPSGHYTFTHYPDGEDRAFRGKPVESAWSHGKRYLWVPFYRRTFDINAQDPSAIAVIDTRTHTIVRLFETGPLPKGVAVSPDNSLLVITHWGDNTVGMIDISSDDISDWHHLPPITIGKRLHLDFPLDRSVNRDANSGYLLRGIAFTPDGRYILISALAGPTAIIDTQNRKMTGFANEAYGLRHIIIAGNTVYGTINVAGQVVSFPVDSLLAGIREFTSGKETSIHIKGGIRRLKVSGGARTIDPSPDGKYLFVACNSGSCVDVVEASTMKIAGRIRCDSYPVGLAVSPDGLYMAVTSQGRDRRGGNAVNLFEIIRPGYIPPSPADEEEINETETAATDSMADESELRLIIRKYGLTAVLSVIVLILFMTAWHAIRKRSRHKQNQDTTPQ